MTGAPTAIATSEPATITSGGAFHNPNAPAPTAAPSRMAESAVHESMRGDIAAGKFTLAEADAILTRDGFKPLGVAPEPAPGTASPPAAGELSADMARWEAQLIKAGVPATVAREKATAVAAAAAEQDAAAAQEAGADAPQEETRPEGVGSDAHEALAMSYEMPKITDAKGNYGPDQMALDRFARGALATLGVDRGIGSAIMNDFARNADVVNAMNEPQRELHDRSEKIRLQSLWKGDFKKNSADVLKLVDALNQTHPGTWAWIDRAGGINADLAVRLHGVLQDLRHRNSQGV